MSRVAFYLSSVVAVAVVALGGSQASGDPSPDGHGTFDPGDRQRVKLELTTVRPGVPTGSKLAIKWRNPDDPEAKPPAVQRIRIRYARGTRVDQSVPARCTATDAELMAFGKSACPDGSQVAFGSVRTDTGSPGVLPRFVDNELTNFNGADGELIGLAESEDPETRVVSRPKLGRRTITIDVPAIPGGPPDFVTAFERLRLKGAELTSGDRAFMTTPQRCRPSGRWTARFKFLYRDGLTQRETVTTPCRPGRA